MLKQGFTLIEIVLVIGILALLLALVLLAINPSRQFSQANNAKRRSDVEALLNAINQYTIDNKGIAPGGLNPTPQVIGNGTGQVDLCAALIPNYLAALPADPLTNGGASINSCNGSYVTNYTASQSATSGRITVIAPTAELGATIMVTR